MLTVPLFCDYAFLRMCETNRDRHFKHRMGSYRDATFVVRTCREEN